MSLYGGIYLLIFTGIYAQRCGHPSLTGVIYLCMGICVQSCGLPCLTGVMCLSFCSLTRICIRKRFWSRVVDNLCKHPSNTYIVIYSDLLRRWTFHKCQYAWKIVTSDRRQEFIPINKQSLSELCSAFGLVLAKPSPK